MIIDYLEQPKVIDITHKNVANIKSDNIVAFTYAAPGAMGDGGALIVGCKDKDFKIYYINTYYNKDAFLVDKVFNGFLNPFMDNADIIKVEDETIINYLGDVKGFEYIPMGFGNSFYIRSECLKEFRLMCTNFIPEIFNCRGTLFRKQTVVMNLFFNDKLSEYKDNILKFTPTIMGAIIGDIVGSRFEFKPHKSKDFELFYSVSENKIPKTVSEYKNGCRFTDDTVMTVAIAKAFLDYREGENDLSQLAIDNMKALGKKYPFAGYGNNFNRWINLPMTEPYNSYGNGSAMRISAAAYYADNLTHLHELVDKVTAITHNHPEGIKGARAVADCIWLALRRESKQSIRKYIERNYYNLDFDYYNLIANYSFDETCQGSVPQAIFAFLISTSFVDAIRTAVSMGGDADTMAAIAGSIAGAYYGVPENLINEAKQYLTKDLLKIIEKFDSVQYILAKSQNDI